ncbi:MAG: acyltransferase [Lachnospiraceae bacterium]
MTGEKNAALQPHKKRMANIELLRILAMMMVVSLHFLAKGELLPSLTGPLNGQGYLGWFLESFSIMAVDVYVLISGYFLVETGFRCKRVISLVLQVMFYTCLIPVVLILTGVLSIQDLTFWNVLLYIFPTNMLHYWFVSAYVLMFLFTPVLNAAVHAMKKQQLQMAIVILLIMESLSKTLIPVRLELDNLGYDAYWFMVVYLIAAYIRLYGISFFEKLGKKSGFIFLLGGISIFIWTMLIRVAYLKTGQFQNFIESAYGYNHLLTIGSAVALFYTFYYVKIHSQSLSRIVCAIAPYTFGVYLLHEHVNIRYEWPKWLGAGNCNSALSLFGHWILAIIIVMGIGLAIDFVRSLIFRLVGKFLAGRKVDLFLQKVDAKLKV